MNSSPVDILLCQRFLPEFGGSIRWMHEVYRRWPHPVHVLTHDYYNHPINTPEFPSTPTPPASGDHVTDSNLHMDRRNIFMHDWGVDKPDSLLRYLRMTNAVRQQLGQHPGRTVRVHAIHAVPEVVSLLPLKRLYGQRLQIICYVHGEEVSACASSRQLTFLMKRAHRITDCLIANSRYTLNLVQPYLDNLQPHIVHPGVDLSEFQNARDAGLQLRRQHQWENRLIVATVGRLDPRKNQLAVLEAIAKLHKRFPELLYLIAGQGRNQPRLLERAKTLGIADRVIFLGNVDGQTKLAVYGACDIFAMPAIQDGTDVEGFGMVFLEAAACGKPSIAGSSGGQPDAVIDQQTGFIVDGMNPPAVESALAQLLEDPPLRQRLGHAGLSHAQQFHWPMIVQRIADLVENISK